MLTARTHHSHHAYALCQLLTFASGVLSSHSIQSLRMTACSRQAWPGYYMCYAMIGWWRTGDVTGISLCQVCYKIFISTVNALQCFWQFASLPFLRFCRQSLLSNIGRLRKFGSENFCRQSSLSVACHRTYGCFAIAAVRRSWRILDLERFGSCHLSGIRGQPTYCSGSIMHGEYWSWNALKLPWTVRQGL